VACSRYRLLAFGTLKWTQDKDEKPWFEHYDSINVENVHEAKDGERK
jgi:hypothetical protein